MPCKDSKVFAHDQAFELILSVARQCKECCLSPPLQFPSQCFLPHPPQSQGLQNHCPRRGSRDLPSERIAYGNVIAKRILELRHIVVSAAAGIVRSVDSHTHIEANDQKLQIVAETEARAQSNLLAKSL